MHVARKYIKLIQILVLTIIPKNEVQIIKQTNNNQYGKYIKVHTWQFQLLAYTISAPSPSSYVLSR